MGNESRIRMTEQRRVILDELQKLTTHPTADELYVLVRRRLPRISLGTVYRSLEALSRSGMIRKLDIGGPRMRFDGTTENHHHVCCAGCGRVDDLPAVTGIGRREREALEKSGYELVERRVELIGICPDCRSGRSDSGNVRLQGKRSRPDGITRRRISGR